MKEALSPFIGKQIVVDTRSNWIYIGTLDQASAHTLVLTEADAHDRSDTEIPKERYIYDSRTGGIRVNRHRVHICMDYVVGVSLLSDIKQFQGCP